MNRKFQHFQKIEKPVITKNFNIHKFDWWMGIISSPIFCQTSSYYSNSRQKKKKKKTLTLVTIPLKKKKKTLTLIHEILTSILLNYFSIHFLW